MSPFVLTAVVFGVIGASLVVAGLSALWRMRPLRFTLRTLTGLLFLALGGLIAAIDLGTIGYRALTTGLLIREVEAEPR